MFIRTEIFSLLLFSAPVVLLLKTVVLLPILFVKQKNALSVACFKAIWNKAQKAYCVLKYYLLRHVAFLTKISHKSAKDMPKYLACSGTNERTVIPGFVLISKKTTPS